MTSESRRKNRNIKPEGGQQWSGAKAPKMPKPSKPEPVVKQVTVDEPVFSGKLVQNGPYKTRKRTIRYK